jgi:1-acyl-sn-glycerol-3-phosphate acyltransferase
MLLGAACLPIVPHSYAKKLQILWSDIMIKSLDLQVNVTDRNTRSDLCIDNNGVGNMVNASKDKPEKGKLYVHLNQQTHLTSLVYTRALPYPIIIMNIEFTMLPFIGWLQHRFGSITIIRQYKQSAKQQLLRAVELLKNGTDIIISIEGKRTEDGSLSEFKKGPIVMAIEAQCDIIPIMTHGEYVLWPRGQYFVLPGGKVDIVLYPAISTIGLGFADRHSLLKQLRDLAEHEKANWEQMNVEYIKQIRKSLTVS